MKKIGLRMDGGATEQVLRFAEEAKVLPRWLLPKTKANAGGLARRTMELSAAAVERTGSFAARFEG